MHPELPVIDCLTKFQQVCRGKLLCGLDLGTTSIGVAISDRQWRQSRPLGQLQRIAGYRDHDDGFRRGMDDIFRKHNINGHIGGYVIGKPYALSGLDSQQHQRHMTFLLKTMHANYPWHAIYFTDERLTTVGAYSALVNSAELGNVGKLRGYKARQITNSRSRQFLEGKDQMAASILLQTVLDRLNIS